MPNDGPDLPIEGLHREQLSWRILGPFAIRNE